MSQLRGKDLVAMAGWAPGASPGRCRGGFARVRLRHRR
jgi:hypothetical protein